MLRHARLHRVLLYPLPTLRCLLTRATCDGVLERVRAGLLQDIFQVIIKSRGRHVLLQGGYALLRRGVRIAVAQGVLVIERFLDGCALQLLNLLVDHLVTHPRHSHNFIQQLPNCFDSLLEAVFLFSGRLLEAGLQPFHQLILPCLVLEPVLISFGLGRIARLGLVAIPQEVTDALACGIRVVLPGALARGEAGRVRTALCLFRPLGDLAWKKLVLPLAQDRSKNLAHPCRAHALTHLACLPDRNQGNFLQQRLQILLFQLGECATLTRPRTGRAGAGRGTPIIAANRCGPKDVRHKLCNVLSALFGLAGVVHAVEEEVLDRADEPTLCVVAQHLDADLRDVDPSCLRLCFLQGVDAILEVAQWRRQLAHLQCVEDCVL
mmetsp:Transcript_40169/g.93352  ORF Transcript_40169/g.93352 Transcript_40169/m.93352 type:complete len:379 (-) Transcript_40169:316-1452(-)